MRPAVNRQFLLAARPVGMVKPSDFAYREEPVPVPGPGQVLVRNIWLSLDPAMRGWMNEGRSYIAPVGIGEVMRGGTVGEVVVSNSPGFPIGRIITGMLGWQDYAISDGKGLSPVPPGPPISTALGVLGMPGLTAYFGLLDVGQPKAGETVVVSAAAGAVGSIVGQIAKITGCRAVGIAGSAQKCRWLVRELGFDAAINYRTENVSDELRAHCPGGIDLYFDNVGGDILDTVLRRINLRARVVICGAISQYNSIGPVPGPSNILSLLVNRARMEGFIVFDYAKRYGEGRAALAAWLAEGRLKYAEDIVEGLENAPVALLRLFEGKNTGKVLVKVSDEPR
ncbi:MAG: NADP-dependent oxidoreductase [Candidatus Rokuibacteriota bacterium]